MNKPRMVRRAGMVTTLGTVALLARLLSPSALADASTSGAAKPLFSSPVTDGQIVNSRIFQELLIPISGNTSGSEDEALAQAVTLYLKNRDDTTPLETFVQSYPKSAWNASLLTNLGIIYETTGYYSKALDAWKKAWALGKKETQYPQSAVIDRAASGLAKLLSGVGRTEELKPLLDELQGRKMYGPSATTIIRTRSALAEMQRNPQKSFKCGPFALGQIEKFLHPGAPYLDSVLAAKSSAKGVSLTQVWDLSEKLKMGYQMAKRTSAAALLLPAVVHWKSGHYAAILKEQHGSYVVQDPTFGYAKILKSAAIDDEQSGYYLVPNGKLPAGWQPVSAEEGNSVWGRASPNNRNGDNTGSGSPGTGGGPPCGMPHYDILLMLACLRIRDTPVVYTPPYGPALDFTVTYNQYEASQPSNSSIPTSNLGYDWIQPWQSYVEPPSASATSGATVTVVTMGGGLETYSPLMLTGTSITTGSFPLQVDTQAELLVMPTTNPARTGAANQQKFERVYPDGRMEIYDSPADTNNYVYLTQIVDPQGNAITLSGTLINSGSSGYQVNTITDSLGQVTTLSYGLADPLKITAITDPFGRAARFGYTEVSSGTLPLFQLTSITDAVGMKSTFNYAPGTSAITSMTTPYGTTTFNSWQGSNGDANLIATDPNGGMERALASFDDPNYTPMPTVPALSFIPSQGLLYGGENWLAEDNTYYWDKKAMEEAPGDETRAHAYHWLFESGLATTVSDVIGAEKKPLETWVFYNYPGRSTNPGLDDLYEGTINKPSGVARLLTTTGTAIQYSTYQYNSLGYMTQSVDPLGRQLNYTYASNGIDLVSVTGSGSTPDVLQQIVYTGTYPAHCPSSITDASGQTTDYTYNGDGQVATISDPLGETTSYSYSSGTGGYLTSVARPMTGATNSYTYDAYGRLATIADSSLYVIGNPATDVIKYSYDALNRPTSISYPDGTYSQYVYDRLDVGWSKDRMDRWTTLTHDADRNLTSVTDPLGRITQYGYCICGALDSITDPAGNTTSWIRDIEGQPSTKIFPDGSQINYQYDAVGRLSSVTDAMSQTTQYSYFLDNDISEVQYTSATRPTPSVFFSYDANYNRLHQVQLSGSAEKYTYAYNPYQSLPLAMATGVGQLASVTGSLATIAYGYDALGRVNSRQIGGAPNYSVGYDSLGRVLTYTNSLCTGTSDFAFGYAGYTDRLASIGYPNGQTTSYQYFNSAGDQRLQTITNLGPATSGTLSQFNYTYNPDGSIASWTRQSGTNGATAYGLQYDQADQLLTATLQNTSPQGILHQYGYGYDPVGNRTTSQLDGQVTGAGFNNLNQLLSTQAGGLMQFTGSLSAPATVTVGGNAATVSGSTFTGFAAVTSGSNQVQVVAKNAGGQTTHAYGVIVSGSAGRTFTYDANGNTLSDGVNTYVWDAANRLTAVNEPGGGQSQFTYDGFGRRVQITESTSGTVTSTKNLVWDGMGIAEETNSSNVVTKIYFREGVQVSGSDYYYTRDHLGSIREITATTGTNVAIVARYDYDPYGQQTQLSGTVTADFGFTGHYIHQPSGLLLAPYRAYSTSLGRWISRDPIAERGGINLYQYAGNDPIAWTDPTGLIRGPFPPQAPLEPGIPPLNPGEGPIIQINPPVPGMGTVPAQPMAPTPTPTPTPPTPTPTPTPTPSSPSPSCSPSPAK